MRISDWSSDVCSSDLFLGLEGFDFAFALDDKAERHRLHPTSRFCSGKFAPKNRRQGEANQIIERTASAIGIDQILIKIARILHGLRDGFFCDRIKGHAINLWRQSLFFPQQDRKGVVQGKSVSVSVKPGG